jgi:hypothetical protein
MACRRVALFDHRRLLGESIERLLLCMDGIELLGPWVIDAQALSKLKTCGPDVVIVVGDLASDAVEDHPGILPVDLAANSTAGSKGPWFNKRSGTKARNSQFVAQILETFNDLPVIRVDLEDAQVRVYSRHALPARRADLIQAILPATPWPEMQPFSDGGNTKCDQENIQP